MEKTYHIGIDARLFGTAQAAGIGIYTEELIGNLIKLDHDNHYTIFVTKDILDFFPFYGKNLKKQTVTFPHYSYSEQFLYPNILSSAKLDLIHYTNFNSPVFSKRVKSVVTIHDLTLWFYPGRRADNWLRRMAYRYVIRKSCENATRVIAVSNRTKEDIIKYLNIDSNRIDVVYEGLPNRYKPVDDVKKIEAIKNKYNISRPFFLCVGQWRPHKNLVRLLRAFALLRHRYNIDYQLVLVGKADINAHEMYTIIKRLGIQESVIATGYVADGDLPYFYSGAEAFVFPSLYEGFGIPPLEAMASGTPVLSSNASVMPEVLGDAALFFNPLDIEDIAQAMYQLATTYRIKKELRDKGFKQVKKYSYTKMAHQTLEVYKKALLEEPSSK